MSPDWCKPTNTVHLQVRPSVALAIHGTDDGVRRTMKLFRVLQLHDYDLNGLFSNIDVLVEPPGWIAR
jgi:hypothetical protein